MSSMYTQRNPLFTIVLLKTNTTGTFGTSAASCEEGKTVNQASQHLQEVSVLLSAFPPSRKWGTEIQTGLPKVTPMSQSSRLSPVPSSLPPWREIISGWNETPPANLWNDWLLAHYWLNCKTSFASGLVSGSTEEYWKSQMTAPQVPVSSPVC